MSSVLIFLSTNHETFIENAKIIIINESIIYHIFIKLTSFAIFIPFMIINPSVNKNINILGCASLNFEATKSFKFLLGSSFFLTLKQSLFEIKNCIILLDDVEFRGNFGDFVIYAVVL